MRSETSSPGQDAEANATSTRRRSFTEDARRTQIVNGAIAVLASEGYGAASLAAIAGRLGISKGVISYHFAGKAELLQEVVREVLRTAGEWMTPRVAAATSFAEALNLYISANLDFLDTHREELFALTEVLSNARTTPGVAEVFGESQRGAVAALEQIFAGGKKAEEFADVHARTAAVSLRASIDAVTGLLREDPDFDVRGYGTQLGRLFGRATGRNS
jgi:TetR/AcrR family fatty acid metabolism transcriptional regulator